MDMIYHQGKSLSEWKEIFKDQFSYRELIKMVRNGENLSKLAAGLEA